MEDNELQVVEETAENTVEQTAEEIVESEKIYTEEDLNNRIDELLPRKLNRKEEKIRKEYEKKYGELEELLKQGLQVNSLEEATENLRDFYSKKGIVVNQPKSTYTEKESEILANAEADEIIKDSTIKEIEEEIRNIVSKGKENMTTKDKTVFMRLNSYLQEEKSKKELAAAGITKEALEDADFKLFAEKLNPEMSMKDKYEMYNQYRPKKEVEPIGSMKGTNSQDTGVKEFYSREEALQFTKEDFDKNPKLFEAVEKSMLKW